MRDRLKKILIEIWELFVDFLEIIFQSAAVNQIRFAKTQNNQFTSYIQLKHYQSRTRKVVVWLSLTAISISAGIFIAPAFFNFETSPEIFIPSGKGDIIVGNISKNQATVMFRTLDAAHENRPLATKATVSVFEDADYRNLIKTAGPDDYAVTHIMTVDGLDEGRQYYFRIAAAEAGDMKNPTVVSAWGGGNDRLKFFAIGEPSVFCSGRQFGSENKNGNAEMFQAETQDDFEKNPEKYLENILLGYGNVGGKESDDSLDKALRVYDVQNENYLYGNKKIQTIISWLTSRPAVSTLIYREEGSEEENEIKISEEKTIKHAAVFITLKPETTYYFKIKAEDDGGGSALSFEYSLRTPRSKETVFDVMANNVKQLANDVGL